MNQFNSLLNRFNSYLYNNFNLYNNINNNSNSSNNNNDYPLTPVNHPNEKEDSSIIVANGTSKNNFSTIPTELVIMILKMLPLQSVYCFSLVCTNFKNLLILPAIHRLVNKTYSKIEFPHKNRISNFLISHFPKNQSNMVVTGDNEEYNQNPVICLWENGKDSTPLKNKFNSFYKPIRLLIQGGESDNYIAAAQCNREGRIEVWNKETHTLLFESSFNKEISCLSANKEELLIGFYEGTAKIYSFSNFLLKNELQIGRPGLEKVFFDSSNEKIIACYASKLKIIDKANTLLHEITEINATHSKYDPQSNYLIYVDKMEKKISLRDLDKIDEEITTFEDSDPSARVTSLHFHSESELLFAGFKTEKLSWSEKLSQAKIVVWNTKTKQLIQSFFTQTSPSPILCDIPNHLHFNATDQVILSAGYKISLWQLNTAPSKIKPLIKILSDFPQGYTEKLIWNESSQQIFALINDKLHLIDYSQTDKKKEAD